MTTSKPQLASTHLFGALKPQPQDALLGILAECRNDRREHKIDLTVGMYRDEIGNTPVMAVVKAAERWLYEHQTSKGYLGPEGDKEFVELLKPFVFGLLQASSPNICGVQTPGGTGAIRLAGELICSAHPSTRVWLALPTWVNYRPLFSAARLNVEAYKSFDVATQKVNFDAVMTALRSASRGDVAVLQASCNNPTGADFSPSEWQQIADCLVERGIVPLLDVAYQGLGDGMDEDVSSVRAILQKVDEALIAYSCDKNFGVYRERVGALYAVTASPTAASCALSNMAALARANWSMPSDHGAAVVRHILQTPSLRGQWLAELDAMRARVNANRQALSSADTRFEPHRLQRGMFSTLALEPAAIARLKEEHAIYMASSGRINIAGFRRDDIAKFVSAVKSVSD